MKSHRQKTPNTIDQHPASKMQIDYAKKLGITLPEGINKSDAQAIIAIELDDDEPASKELIEYAREKEMLCSDYVGNKYLHNLLFDNLSIEDQVTFFCFCIYKFYNPEEQENLLVHPLRERFEAFGNVYSKDAYFMASLEEYYGEELIAFGKSEKTLASGKKKTIYGASVLTRAYKVAKEYIDNH